MAVNVEAPFRTANAVILNTKSDVPDLSFKSQDLHAQSGVIWRTHDPKADVTHM